MKNQKEVIPTERVRYESPRAMRLSDAARAHGICQPWGSYASGDCVGDGSGAVACQGMGNHAGDGCRSTGLTATECSYGDWAQF
jgi:hypothetical protein